MKKAIKELAAKAATKDEKKKIIEMVDRKLAELDEANDKHKEIAAESKAERLKLTKLETKLEKFKIDAEEAKEATEELLVQVRAEQKEHKSTKVSVDQALKAYNDFVKVEEVKIKKQKQEADKMVADAAVMKTEAAALKSKYEDKIAKMEAFLKD